MVWTHRAIKLVRGLKDLNIVGMDVVEVAPAYDQSEITLWRPRIAGIRKFYIQSGEEEGRVKLFAEPALRYPAHRSGYLDSVRVSYTIAHMLCACGGRRDRRTSSFDDPLPVLPVSSCWWRVLPD